MITASPSRTIVTGYPSTMGDDVQLNTTTLIRHAARTHPEREIVYRRPDGEWDRYTYAAAYERVVPRRALPPDAASPVPWRTYPSGA